MDITLDLAETDPAQLPVIKKTFQQWLADFSLTAHDGFCAEESAINEKKRICYAVKAVKEDLITTTQQLHERFYNLGVQIFIKFHHDKSKVGRGSLHE